MKTKKVACSSKVNENTIRLLDKLNNLTGMTKGEIVDLAIAELHAKTSTEKSLMIYIKREEDRTFILNSISKQCTSAYEKVLDDMKEYYHLDI